MTLADEMAGLEIAAAVEPIQALDLFAGTGWGVACHRLGIIEHGVELMAEAVATREANGMSTIYRDVWEGLDRPTLITDAVREARRSALGRIHDGTASHYDLLIASPPCQTFSVAGGGAGRRALNEVLQAIAERDYLDPAALKAFGERHDERTALVLSPLAYIARDLPRIVVLEQVPTVLPVWEACADVMRSWGYSVVTAVLSSEQYGVPQTRKRAILIGRWDAEAKMPTPTHSAYYPRDPKRLDPGVLPWVSMADALGRIEALRSNYNTGRGTNAGERGERKASQPAPTVTSKVNRNLWRFAGAGATAAQTSQQRQREQDEPAHTITGAGSAAWTHDRPATTIQGDARVWAPGHKVNADDEARLGQDAARERYGDRAGTTAQRVTVEEAAALQSYPVGFRWDVDYLDPRDGKRKPVSQSRRYLQVGNAVPPLLAEAVLRAALGLEAGRD